MLFDFLEKCFNIESMDANKRICRLFSMAGLKPEESVLYQYVLENSGCSIIDAAKKCRVPKTSAYRAFEALMARGLIKTVGDSWKNNLDALPITGFIKKLENQQKNMRRLAQELKSLFLLKKIPESSLSIPQIEVFKGDDALGKYLDLSEMQWFANFSFGNWEDLNKNGHLIPLERKFIRNRLKKGANAFSYIMKGGPCISEITKYDEFEDRVTKVADDGEYKPMWVNAFDGNNFVYIWTLDEKKKLIGTFIDSEPVADFYKNYVHSLLV